MTTAPLTTRRARPAPQVPYAGVATRAVALAIDAGIAQAIVFSGGAVIALIASLAADLTPGLITALLATSAWFLIVGGYFVIFWTTAGQTPGMRLMGLRLRDAHVDVPPRLARSLARVVALGACIAPGFLGFLPVLLDDRRRGLHDLAARTVVVYERDR